MLNTLVTNLVTLLTTALTGTGVSISATGVNLNNLQTATWAISLQKHSSVYQDVSRNQRSVTLQLTYFNSTTDPAIWETKLRETMWLILAALETCDLGTGIYWSGAMSEGEATAEYSDVNQIPAYKMQVTFVMSQTVR